jgi:hypothetical protein
MSFCQHYYFLGNVRKEGVKEVLFSLYFGLSIVLVVVQNIFTGLLLLNQEEKTRFPAE